MKQSFSVSTSKPFVLIKLQDSSLVLYRVEQDGIIAKYVR